jgi:hypothetical protein
VFWGNFELEIIKELKLGVNIEDQFLGTSILCFHFLFSVLKWDIIIMLPLLKWGNWLMLKLNFPTPFCLFVCHMVEQLQFNNSKVCIRNSKIFLCGVKLWGLQHKVRSPILWVYGGFYTVYYKDVGEFQILYLQDICW